MKLWRINKKISVSVFILIIPAINTLFSCHYTFVSSETRGFHANNLIRSLEDLAVPHQNSSYEEGLVVGDNETCTIEDSDQLIGNITIKDHATLIIRDALVNQDDYDRVGITVMNQANLIVTNATLIISQVFSSKILVQDDAIVNIANSNIVNPEQDILIWAEDSSTVYIENSVMSGLKNCKVVADDYSEVHVHNSTFDRMTVWGSSTVFLASSTLGEAVRAFGNSTIHVSDSTISYVTADGDLSLYIRNSNIESYIRTGSSSDVWLIHTVVPEIWAGGSSKLWLIDSSVEAFHEYDEARVFVGWDLPVFGPVAFHHTLVVVVQLFAIVLVGVMVFLVLFFLIRRLWKRSRVHEGSGPVMYCANLPQFSVF